MLVKKYKSIMEREESYRSRWALGSTLFCSFLILISFAFYKGFLSFGAGDGIIAKQKPESQLASVVSAEKVPSPIQNTKKTFQSAFYEIGKQYQDFKDSLSAVFVPFITGIEIYERK